MGDFFKILWLSQNIWNLVSNFQRIFWKKYILSPLHCVDGARRVVDSNIAVVVCHHKAKPPMKANNRRANKGYCTLYVYPWNHIGYLYEPIEPNVIPCLYIHVCNIYYVSLLRSTMPIEKFNSTVTRLFWKYCRWPTWN